MVCFFRTPDSNYDFEVCKICTAWKQFHTACIWGINVTCIYTSAYIPRICAAYIYIYMYGVYKTYVYGAYGALTVHINGLHTALSRKMRSWVSLGLQVEVPGALLICKMRSWGFSIRFHESPIAEGIFQLRVMTRVRLQRANLFKNHFCFFSF